MTLTPAFIGSLAVLLIAQTGALIFFAGVVATTLRQHGDALETHSETCANCKRVVTILADREGVSM